MTKGYRVKIFHPLYFYPIFEKLNGTQHRACLVTRARKGKKLPQVEIQPTTVTLYRL